MKLRNKKTGEIKAFDEVMREAYKWNNYNSLAELNAEWEDYEELKEWWYIDIHGPHKVTNNDEYYQQVKAASKEIGNYFETKEEAEKAVEKLKAWKRLKDKGLIFSINKDEMKIIYDFSEISAWTTEVELDLDLLFGGEE